jgi:hypothetical protein
MNNRLSSGFTGGVLGALLLILIMYILMLLGMGTPAFLKMYRAVFSENPPIDHFIAGLLFLLAGGLWGLLFAAVVKHPTILKGMLFGLLPTFFLWVVINPIIGQPLFNDFTVKGLLMPLFFNVVVWGTFIGWYLGRVPVSSGAHHV